MKRLLALLIIGLLCIVASGCGPSQTASTSGDTNKRASVKQTQPAEQTTQATWNTEDMDVSSNGNVPVAIEFIKDTANPTQAVESAAPAEAFKAPWKYYGKIVAATGSIGIIQEYPPGSDLYNLVGGDCGEILLATDDGTLIDYLQIGSTGEAQVGDVVTLYGTPAGQCTVDNKLGGQTTELFVVGKTISAQ